MEEKTQNAFRTLEAGDISLFDLNPEGIFMLGNTIVGKTTSCYTLSDQPVHVRKVGDDKFVLQPTTRRFSAKVGNQTDSETEIPNIFQTFVTNPQTGQRFKTLLIDQPGYGDTYGFHRILTNGYFHYRSFSKTLKIKFVLTFSQDIIRKLSNPKLSLIAETKRFGYQIKFASTETFFMKTSKLSLQEQKQIIFVTFKLTQLLAKGLCSLDRLQEAKDCFNSINDPNSLFQVFDMQCRSTKRQSQLRKILVQYGRAAKKYDKGELANQCFQKAYTLSNNCQEIDEASHQIIEYYDENQRKLCSHIEKLRQRSYCQDLSQRVKKWCSMI